MNAPLRIGVAGLGNVGASLLRLIERHGNDLAVRTGRPISVAAVSARDRRKDRAVDTAKFAWFDDPVALARDPGNDVFVELVGGADGVALASVGAAIKVGKHVVTANKALLAR
ncbi:MAG: homoserine dehydrogenase, partial [Bauldia sp.]|nr:homoserine dehydrogenase [Bauldia sp.]